MSQTDEQLTAMLVPLEYQIQVGGKSVRITRFTNHGTLIPNNQWVACCREHYVTQCQEQWNYGNRVGSWIWAYKFYTGFSTPVQAVRAAMAASDVFLKAKEVTA